MVARFSPFGVLALEGFDTIHGEQELKIERVLRPQGAVVVERGDPLALRYEVGAIRVGDSRDEVEDGLFGRTLVPGR